MEARSQFVEMIEKAGVCDLEEEKKTFKIQEPLFWSQGDIHLVAIPSDEFRFSYTLHYPHSTAIGTQFYSFVLSSRGF